MKRNEFIANLRRIHHQSDLSTIERYREMGKVCKLAGYFNANNKFYKINKNTLQWEFVSKPPFKEISNGFVAVNVAVPTTGDEKSPIIPFFSIAIEGKGNDSKKLREQVLNIAQNSVKEGFLTCPQFVNEDHIERIIFEIEIIDGQINRIDVPTHTPPTFYNGDHRSIKSIVKNIREKHKNSFIQSWCEPFLEKGKNITLYCNIRAVDWDSEEVKSHSIFVCMFESESTITDWVGAYGDDAMNIIAMLKSVFISDSQRKQMSEALKSAVSAIMSRNMSHNLGSHYLYYTKTYLEDLANTSESLGPDIRGAAKVLGYMQARMDYLATVISNDRYPNGAVNFKSQLYDELTVDDFSKRHFSEEEDKYRRTTNFLLSNLIMSENFTRPGIVTKDIALDQDKVAGNFKPISLCVKLWDEEKNLFETFTGSVENMDIENNVKNQLSKINIALPGGTMSAHAFFNVVENFIRNSAKYLREDFDESGLVFTIAIKRNKKDKKLLDIVIYDNKKNARKVLPVLHKQLRELTILDEQGSIEKSAKGIKEMLFSSVWMRSYQYPTETFVDIIQRIQEEKGSKDKIKLINEYGFSFVAVSDTGEIVKDKSSDSNLGIKITLPEFSRSTEFHAKKSEKEKDIISNCLKISSDIVCLSPETEKILEKHPDFFTYFTRLFKEKEYDIKAFNTFYEASRIVDKSDNTTAEIAYRFKSVLDARFKQETDGDIDNLCLMIGGGKRDKKRIPENNHDIVYFERHLNNKGFDDYLDYAYVDSISGGNFTITLNSLLDQGITKGSCLYKTWSDKLLGLKIIESALTRITLIDERLFNSMISDGKQMKLELALKNIRVLNVNIEKKIKDVKNLEDLFEGNQFMNNSDYTHFLSIHLGLIEKIVKSDWGKKKYGNNTKLEDKVTRFMNDLQRIFGKGERVFISVHSGRGNFSKELEGPLASYPFISLSAIENAFNNSKYLLAQLFYNTIYIGKGKINE